MFAVRETQAAPRAKTTQQLVEAAQKLLEEAYRLTDSAQDRLSKAEDILVAIGSATTDTPE